MDYVLPIKAGVSVYHGALAGRVQRYSPIYYPDSHANSALAPADSLLGCLCLTCSSVYVAPLLIPFSSHSHRFTEFYLRPTDTVAVVCLLFLPELHVRVNLCMDTYGDAFRHSCESNDPPQSRPTWQGFQMTLHPRY